MVLKIPRVKSIFSQSIKSGEGLNAKSKDEIGFASITGTNFLPDDQADVYNRGRNGVLVVGGDGQYHADIQLPHGATITKVIVWGNNMTGETWDFTRFLLGSNTGTTIANNIDFGTEHNTAQDKVWIVDNSLYSYKFSTTFLNQVADMRIEGARVEYILK